MPIEFFFTYHLKAHTISNKLISKVFAQKGVEKSYDSYKYVFKFRWFQVASPPPPPPPPLPLPSRSAINWHKRFMEIMIACIPRKSLRRRRNLPWLTKNIIQHIRKRNAAFQAAKNSAKTEKYSKFRKRNEVVSMLRNAKSSYFKKINPHNKKQFWKSIKYLSKQQSGIPALHHHDKIAESDYEKASMLNEFFFDLF